MAPAYKLTYFDIRGLGESIRFLFKYGNIDFEDVRIKREGWPEIKGNYPFGVLPLLEHDGKQVGESAAIARYVAKLVKLGGKDDWEDLEIDAVVDSFTDMRLKLRTVHLEQDEAKKKILMEAALKETLPYYLRRFEALVQKNKGYLALGRLTWADLFIVSLVPTLDTIIVGGKLLDSYPHLKALQEKVEALPGIKEWIEVRPKTVT